MKPDSLSCLISDFKQAVVLVREASGLVDYEDEKDPTYGIKYECEKFLKMVALRYGKPLKSKQRESRTT